MTPTVLPLSKDALYEHLKEMAQNSEKKRKREVELEESNKKLRAEIQQTTEKIGRYRHYLELAETKYRKSMHRAYRDIMRMEDTLENVRNRVVKLEVDIAWKEDVYAQGRLAPAFLLE